MAEHNTQDTKSPVPPRRGARPFVGPAGGPGQPLPLLRTTPMPRPAGAPFVPLPIARTALGTVARASAPAPAPTPSPAPEPAVEAVAAVPEPAPLVDPALGSATTAELMKWSSVGADAADAVDAATHAPTDELLMPATESSPYDQFAAFDAAWHEAALERPEPAAATNPPLDLPSLGAGDVHLPWADDVTSPPDLAPSSDASGPAWLMDDVESPAAALPGDASTTVAPPPAGELSGSAVTPAEGDDEAAIEAVGDDASWADVTVMPSADAIMAATIESTQFTDDAIAPAGEPELPAGEWPDPLLAEYAPYVPTPTVAEPTVGWDPGARRQTHADVEERHEIHVAATLERLAERVRHGEIDVSSVAPGGPEAAVLAAVLAALLGGGRSSSR
jgi:hypothetical protein